MKPISYTFQGRVLNAMTVREILQAIFPNTDFEVGPITISVYDPVLDTYPRILEDDGMGYGIKPRYITDVDTEQYKEKLSVLDVPKPPFEDLAKLSELADKRHVEKVTVFNVWSEPDPTDLDEEEELEEDDDE